MSQFVWGMVVGALGAALTACVCGFVWIVQGPPDDYDFTSGIEWLHADEER